MRVLVIGAGPGGLAAAASFAAQGVEVVVAEEQPEGTILGSELMLPVMVHAFLERLGILERCMEEGVPGSEMVLVPHHGVPPMCVPLPELIEGREPRGIGITRPNLLGALRDRVAELGVEIRYGTPALIVRQEASDVVVSLGDSEETYDLVVAADGVFSRTRSAVFPEVPAPTPAGEGAWRALLQRTEKSPEQMISIVYGPDRRKVGLINVTADDMYLFMLEPAEEGRRFDRDTMPQELRSRLAGFTDQVAEARDGLHDGTYVHYSTLHLLSVPAPWHRGRVVLIGDAAHAVTPHLSYGAGLSMEDGVILADCVLDAASVEDGLKAFSERRFARCDDAVRACAKLVESELHPGDVDFNPIHVTNDVWRRLAEPA
ncbi:FAD-dependent monooxygenase [Streptomyces sp. NPDC091215]|uniref:FAD-dependent monooxygenase n=1 Tax=Streptomyces sp. NPDC091215 TaxID=3155192 RepID=UPI0034427E24